MNLPDTEALTISYLAERSIPDELIDETSKNVLVVILSYLFMFLYISIAIGSFPSKIYSGFLLGISGIFIILFSIACALGISGFAGIKLSMISAEVVPFLVLAIGVDNMFIITNSVRRSKASTVDR